MIDQLLPDGSGRRSCSTCGEVYMPYRGHFCHPAEVRKECRRRGLTIGLNVAALLFLSFAATYMFLRFMVGW